MKPSPELWQLITMLLTGLTTLGFFLGVFLLKKIVTAQESNSFSLAKIDKDLSVLAEKGRTREKSINDLQLEHKILRDRIEDIRHRIHDLVNNKIAKIDLIEMRVRYIEKNKGYKSDLDTTRD